MTLRKIFIVLSFVFFSCTPNSNKQSIDIYGSDFSYESIETISDLTNNANKFLDKENTFSIIKETFSNSL